MINSKDKTIFYNLVDVVKKHDICKMLFLFTEDIEIDSVMFGYWKGKLKVKELVYSIFHAFPNLFMKPGTLIFNGKGVMAAEIDFGGQHLAEFKGSPGMGNKFYVRGAFILNFTVSEKIISIRSYYDSRLINRQLEILKF
jgi:predicted ester cyclase